MERAAPTSRTPASRVSSPVQMWLPLRRCLLHRAIGTAHPPSPAAVVNRRGLWADSSSPSNFRFREPGLPVVVLFKVIRGFAEAMESADLNAAIPRPPAPTPMQ